MRRRIMYGDMPRLTQKYRENFSRGDYECKLLMRDHKDAPVIISQSKDASIWKVEHNFSCVFFASYEEAIDYCQSRFIELEDMQS